jgi:hypothetical protein
MKEGENAGYKDISSCSIFQVSDTQSIAILNKTRHTITTLELLTGGETIMNI